MTEGNLNFGLIGGRDSIRSADYKSAGSHQVEVNKLSSQSVAGHYEIHTVTTGKTLYITAVYLTTSNTTAASSGFATGAAASEVIFMQFQHSQGEPIIMALPTPIKISSGTRITAYFGTSNQGYIGFVGWEE